MPSGKSAYPKCSVPLHRYDTRVQMIPSCSKRFSRCRQDSSTGCRWCGPAAQPGGGLLAQRLACARLLACSTQKPLLHRCGLIIRLPGDGVASGNSLRILRWAGPARRRPADQAVGQSARLLACRFLFSSTCLGKLRHGRASEKLDDSCLAQCP